LEDVPEARERRDGRDRAHAVRDPGISRGEDREAGAGRRTEQRDTTSRCARHRDERVYRLGRHLAPSHAGQLGRDGDEACGRQPSQEAADGRLVDATRGRGVRVHDDRTRAAARQGDECVHANDARPPARLAAAAEADGQNGEAADHAAASSSIVVRRHRYQSL
jgi:hypothetical protein